MRTVMRYIAAALPLIATAAVTPEAMEAAYSARGYMAVGGEWLIIPLGVVLSVMAWRAARRWAERFERLGRRSRKRKTVYVAE